MFTTGTGREDTATAQAAPDIFDLKPCRYCGGRGEIAKKQFSNFEPRPQIVCRKCGLTTRIFGTVEEAVTYWNK